MFLLLVQTFWAKSKDTSYFLSHFEMEWATSLTLWYIELITCRRQFGLFLLEKFSRKKQCKRMADFVPLHYQSSLCFRQCNTKSWTIVKMNNLIFCLNWEKEKLLLHSSLLQLTISLLIIFNSIEATQLKKTKRNNQLIIKLYDK